MAWRYRWSSLRWPLAMSLAWCLLMIALYSRGSAEKDAHTNELALIQARTLYSQIVDTRAWNAAHGGVYVPESVYGSPNPWIPESQRTLELGNGQRLVLMNPAYMSRQIGERTAVHGSSFRITSYKPLRPENGSDLWETKALTQCVNGDKEVFALTNDAQGKRYRFLGALHTQKDCLSCHAGSQVGDVRGGISVTLDAQPFLQAIEEQDKNLRWAFGLMGLTGVLGIGGGNALWRRKRLLAEERERMKSTFLANMSHDMRTPLTGILGMTELLERPLGQHQQREALRYLQLAGAALLEMVTDITDYSALEAGQMQFTERPFDVRLALRRCMDLFHPQCRAKNLGMHLEVDDVVPTLVLGDEFRLRQALGNLIGNGVKFTASGGITVKVAVAPVSGSAAVGHAVVLRFAVQDTGMGIAPRDQRRIFERFERGSAASEGYGGTGLGLSIAQDIARLMCGGLEVHSEVGKGACFILTLRFAPLSPQEEQCPVRAPSFAQAPLAVPGSAADSVADGAVDRTAHKGAPGDAHTVSPKRSFRVLVGEDNAITTHYIEQVLHQGGYTVRTARDGQAVLEMLEEEPADLLLLDMRMPRLDGLSTARILREKEERNGTCPLPVVVLSASISPQEREAFAALGVAAHMLKPIGARELWRVVASVLGTPPEGGQGEGTEDYTASVAKPVPDAGPLACAVSVPVADPVSGEGAASGAEQPSPAPSVSAGPQGVPLFDRAAALVDLDGDVSLLRRLCALWPEEMVRQREELCDAWSVGDAATVHRLAHTWKNSSAVLHLRRLYLMCAALEKADVHQWEELLPQVLAAEAEAQSALRKELQEDLC